MLLCAKPEKARKNKDMYKGMCHSDRREGAGKSSLTFLPPFPELGKEARWKNKCFFFFFLRISSS